MPPKSKTPKKAASRATPAASKKPAAKAPVANGSPAKSQTERSPSPKKRALPEASIEEAPTNKKQKGSPITPKKNSPTAQRFPSPPDQPATKFDQESWQGFCEIESEASYFSLMLREMGVKDVTVRELYAVDPASLFELPHPVHGLILCFRARQVDSEKQEEECPPNVWFANQLPAQNSCATLAMINILMNAEDVDVGENLQQFKNFTTLFAPFQRGEALASFDFVKRIHNSFAKKMDILENDRQLAYKVNRSKEMQKSKEVRRNSKDSTASSNSTASFEENAHHFIAFVPIDGEVWKLDGMDAQPTCMGAFDEAKGEDWLLSVSDKIMAIMTAGDNDYQIMALVQNPLLRLRTEMCTAVATIKLIESRLDTLDKEWPAFVVAEDGVTPGAPITPTFLSSLGVPQDQLATVSVSEAITKKIASEDLPALLEHRDDLVEEQGRLIAEILAEIATEDENDQRAQARRHDYGPMISKWLQMLAANGYLEQNLDRHMPDRDGQTPAQKAKAS